LKKYDLIVGANGQDGRLLAEIYLKNNHNVVLVGRGKQEIINKSQIYIEQDLLKYENLKTVIDNYSIDTVYYFAAKHTTQKNFTQLDNEDVRVVNYEAPKWLLKQLCEKQNIRSFVYTSSKLVFNDKNGIFDQYCDRRRDNEYSKWKNEFEIFADTFKNDIERILILWLSNHDSIYRKKEFLLPRVVDLLAQVLADKKNINIEQFNLMNDWGDAREFMEIIYEFIQSDNRKGIFKQFLSNNDVCSLDKIISEILLYKSEYGEYLEKYDIKKNNIFFVNQKEFLRRPEITTRRVIWRLLKNQLTI